jgi:hypothetical protein
VISSSLKAKSRSSQEIKINYSDAAKDEKNLMEYFIIIAFKHLSGLSARMVSCDLRFR